LTREIGHQQLSSDPDAPASAVGRVELSKTRPVALAVGGRIDEVAVEVGDQVKAGDLLMTLETTQLNWAVEQAEINFETARIAFEELGKEIEESDIAVAEANLLSAQENLALVKAGPTKEELAAAQSSAAAAWARYNELKEQPTQAQINQALASLKKAEISVQQAQREYDKIAWLPEAAASAAADNLQRATVDYEAVKANFEEVNKPATEAELQSALSGAQQAQHNLNRLQKKPTAAELAEAAAKVAAAEATLEKLKKGPEESDLRVAELKVRQAMIGLEQARLNLENARVTAPVNGIVVAINTEVGQQANAGSVAAILADAANIELVVNVEQKDFTKIAVGQLAELSVFSLPDVAFKGAVEKIAPLADSGTGFVTFPITIRFTDGPVEQLRPGMTASALFTLLDKSKPAEKAPEEGKAQEGATQAGQTNEEKPPESKSGN
jgi:HlyD family secretion protein